MKNLDTIDKLINILGCSVAFYVSNFFSSLCLCFVGGILPYSFFKNTHYFDIFDKYQDNILIVLIMIFFFLIVQSGIIF